MRAPPPVEVASAAGRVLGAALCALVGGAVAVTLAWGLPFVAVHSGDAHPDPVVALLADGRAQAALATGVGLLVAAIFGLARGGRRAGERTLRWDGREWRLASGPHGGDEIPGEATLMLDLGPWMLVRFLPAAAGFGSATWLPFRIAGDLARWSALRGALWNARGGAARRP